MAILAAASILAAGATAFAAGNGNMDESKFDMAKVANAKVDLLKAVDAATTTVGGTAVDAGLSDEGGQAGWEVEMAQNDGTTKTVVVDMTSGKVDTTPKLENGGSEKSGESGTEASGNEAGRRNCRLNDFGVWHNRDVRAGKCRARTFRVQQKSRKTPINQG